jgi:hypothetical protein
MVARRAGTSPPLIPPPQEEYASGLEIFPSFSGKHFHQTLRPRLKFTGPSPRAGVDTWPSGVPPPGDEALCHGNHNVSKT